jgi:hypothetical protein
MLFDGRDDLVERSCSTSRDLREGRRWHRLCNVGDGSLRRLMVLSFGAIMHSVELDCASERRAVIFHSPLRALTT